MIDHSSVEEIRALFGKISDQFSQHVSQRASAKVPGKDPCQGLFTCTSSGAIVMAELHPMKLGDSVQGGSSKPAEDATHLLKLALKLTRAGVVTHVGSRLRVRINAGADDAARKLGQALHTFEKSLTAPPVSATPFGPNGQEATANVVNITKARAAAASGHLKP